MKKDSTIQIQLHFFTIRHPRLKKACDRSGTAPIKAAMGWLNGDRSVKLIFLN